MITIYVQQQANIKAIEITSANMKLISDALWIDMLNPSNKEEKLVEKLLNLDVPTKKEMQEIEPSSRLYTDDSTLFMTATMVANSTSEEPQSDAVTFILTENKLVTIRYIEPHSFKVFISRLCRVTKRESSAEKILIGLLETTTDRLADILENVSHAFDGISHKIFHSREADENAEKINYKEVLQSIGSNGDLGTKARESLVSFIRLVSFLEQTNGPDLDPHIRSALTIISRDIHSLSDYAGFISAKVSFLLDATLGMVNIEQNNIIKIFSVAAVIFLPPTLIASIYGMNFDIMPELHTGFGYPISIMLMMISAWLPYRYFKRKKWL
jgi:magnesium transporter